MLLRPFIFLLLALLAACAAQPITPAAPTVAPVDAPAPEPVYKPFPTATLEALLTAEFAAMRQQPMLTLQTYVAQAHQTRDPNVVARATTVAQILNQPESLEMSQLWTEVAPTTVDAWYLLCLNSLRQSRFDIAIPALDRLIKLQPEADLEQLFLAALPRDQSARDELFTRLGELGKAHPDNAYLLFGQALLKAQDNKPTEALAIAQAARRLNPQAIQTTLLEAKMLTDLGRIKEAPQLLADALKSQPNSYNLRLNYARSLIRADEFSAAEHEFQALVERAPQDDSLHLSLALIAFDNHHDDIAKHELLTLQDSSTYASEARYYLGQLALRQDDKPAALDAFESVEMGDRYLPAQAEITRLLIADGHIDEARARLAQARGQMPELQVPLYQLEAELLDETGQREAAWNLLSDALKEQPENAQLLLSRAMIAERLNRLDDFETDIREALRYEPDDPSILNALGYVLANRTNRLDEAESYIRRAYALKPDDPAIIDSLGWLEFKRGNVTAALVDLRRAYGLFPDDEIAAHLGEALWVTGKHDEARCLWDEALRQHPKSEYIPDTRQRLDPS